MAMNSRIPVSRRRRSRQRGNAMVEVALTFMGFILLTVGTMEFAMATYAYNFCSYGARDATRWASVHGSQSATSTTCTSTQGIADGCSANSTDVLNYVKGLAVALDPAKLTVTTTWTPDNNPGSLVQVKVQYIAVPLAHLALKDNLTLSGTSQMVIVR